MESSIWSRSANPEARHFIVAVYFALGFLLARFCLDKFIFRRLAVCLLSNGSASLKMDEATQAKIAKCSESMWKLAFYGTVETCVLKISYHEPRFRDTKGYFWGWPDQELKLPLSLFYMCQCGFYIYRHCCTPYLGDSKEGFFCDDVSSCNNCYPDWILIHYKLFPHWFNYPCPT